MYHAIKNVEGFSCRFRFPRGARGVGGEEGKGRHRCLIGIGVVAVSSGRVAGCSVSEIGRGWEKITHALKIFFCCCCLVSHGQWQSQATVGVSGVELLGPVGLNGKEITPDNRQKKSNADRELN